MKTLLRPDAKRYTVTVRFSKIYKIPSKFSLRTQRNESRKSGIVGAKLPSFVNILLLLFFLIF